MAKPDIPLVLLVLGGIGFGVGIFFLGERTISTVGSKITQMTPSKAFSTQLGGAVAVMSSSALGMPVSTSHCLVGSVIGIGIASKLIGKPANIDMNVLKKIILSWIITIPLSMIAACLIFLLMDSAFFPIQ